LISLALGEEVVADNCHCLSSSIRSTSRSNGYYHRVSGSMRHSVGSIDDDMQHRRQPLNSNCHHGGIERHGSVRSGSRPFHLPEEYNDESRGRRGRSVKASDIHSSDRLSSSRGRSSSIARPEASRTRSTSRHNSGSILSPPHRDQGGTASSGGRSLSMARTPRSSSRAPSQARANTRNEHQVPEEKMERSRSKSRARSMSRASKSSRRMERPADEYYERHAQITYNESSRGRSSSRSAAPNPPNKDTSASRKFIVEICSTSNDIIGVNEVVDDALSEGSPFSGRVKKETSFHEEMDRSSARIHHQQQEQSGRRQATAHRSRSKSILRSSNNDLRGSLSSQERVSFAVDNDVSSSFDRRSVDFLHEKESDYSRGREAPSRSMISQDYSVPRQTRSLSRPRNHVVNDVVDFDPKSNSSFIDRRSLDKYNNLGTLLKKPQHPGYRSSFRTSNNTQETVLTIDDDDDDDSFAPGSTRMQEIMHQYVMEDVEEESDDDGTILSDCPVAENRREYNRAKSLEPNNPRHSSNHDIHDNHTKQERQSRFKAMISRKSHSKRQMIVPYSSDSRKSLDTEGTAMTSCTDEDQNKPSLCVDRAENSLKLHQNKPSPQEQSSSSGKKKSRFSRFLHR
jgi:hypothetical protein